MICEGTEQPCDRNCLMGDCFALGQYPQLWFFTTEHLPPELAAVSQPFAELARKMTADALAGVKTARLENAAAIPVEATEGLRHLLAAKDCAVRAAVVAQGKV